MFNVYHQHIYMNTHLCQNNVLFTHDLTVWGNTFGFHWSRQSTGFIFVGWLPILLYFQVTSCIFHICYSKGKLEVRMLSWKLPQAPVLLVSDGTTDGAADGPPAAARWQLRLALHLLLLDDSWIKAQVSAAGVDIFQNLDKFCLELYFWNHGMLLKIRLNATIMYDI